MEEQKLEDEKQVIWVQEQRERRDKETVNPEIPTSVSFGSTTLGLLPSIYETTDGSTGEANVVSVDAPFMENFSFNAKNFSFTTLSEGPQGEEWQDSNHDHKRGSLEADHTTILTPQRPARGAGRTAEAAMVSEETGGESGVTDQPNWAWVMVGQRVRY